MKTKKEMNEKAKSLLHEIATPTERRYLLGIERDMLKVSELAPDNPHGVTAKEIVRAVKTHEELVAIFTELTARIEEVKNSVSVNAREDLHACNQDAKEALVRAEGK